MQRVVETQSYCTSSWHQKHLTMSCSQCSCMTQPLCCTVPGVLHNRQVSPSSTAAILQLHGAQPGPAPLHRAGKLGPQQHRCRCSCAAAAGTSSAEAGCHHGLPPVHTVSIQHKQWHCCTLAITTWQADYYSACMPSTIWSHQLQQCSCRINKVQPVCSNTDVQPTEAILPHVSRQGSSSKWCGLQVFCRERQLPSPAAAALQDASHGGRTQRAADHQAPLDAAADTRLSQCRTCSCCCWQ